MVHDVTGAPAIYRSDESQITGMVNDMVRDRLENDPLFEDKGLAKTIMELGPLGLRLNMTPELVKSIETALNMQDGSRRRRSHDPYHGGGEESSEMSQREKEKLKASNFPAGLLRIGSWKVVSRNEGDLVAKCYFAKQKLVWEVLGTKEKLKRKIEIQWSDISAIKATMLPNQPATLEIELSKPPTFFQEQNPQPRKHTIWKGTEDFTDGQAPLHRRHFLKFPPGSLDRHYEKILQADPRLLKLSHQQFPSHPSPYFSDSSRFGFSVDFSGRTSDFPAPVWPFQFPSQPPQPYPYGLSGSPDSVIDHLLIDDGAMTNTYRTNMGHWSGSSDVGTKDQILVQQQPMIRNAITHVFPLQDYQSAAAAAYDEAMLATQIWNMKPQLNASDSETGFDQDQRTYIDGVDSFQNLITQIHGDDYQFGSIAGIYPLHQADNDHDHDHNHNHSHTMDTNNSLLYQYPPFIQDSWI